MPPRSPRRFPRPRPFPFPRLARARPRCPLRLLALLSLPLALWPLVGCGPPPPNVSGGATGPPVAAPAGTVAPRYIQVAITAYSWHDNEPPGLGSNGSPVLHETADGQGTYADPISLSLSQGTEKRYPPGTRLYLPTLRRYFIAEDFEQRPGPPGTEALVSVWIDGRNATQAEADACASDVTGEGVTSMEVDPPAGRAIITGPILASLGCDIPPP